MCLVFQWLLNVNAACHTRGPDHQIYEDLLLVRPFVTLNLWFILSKYSYEDKDVKVRGGGTGYWTGHWTGRGISC